MDHQPNRNNNGPASSISRPPDEPSSSSNNNGQRVTSNLPSNAAAAPRLVLGQRSATSLRTRRTYHNQNPSLPSSGGTSLSSSSSSSPLSPRPAGAAFRHTILKASLDHRRCIPHSNGMTRSILETLYDRQCRGVRAVAPFCRPWHPTGKHQQLPPTPEPELAATGEEEERHVESPSTVFDTVSLHTNAPSSSVSSRPPQQQSQAPPSSQPPNDDDVEEESRMREGSTSSTAEPNTSSSQEQPKLTKPPLQAAPQQQPQNMSTLSSSSSYREMGPCTIHSELVYFVEYISSVGYHSAFLPHLGGNDERDEHGHRPVSSRAVSTISIAFSPDGQAVASTHGDHSVKIASCLTGRLLQSLEGHPRTPWTVKFHPTRSNLVASGCLGHQVRIWNWPERTCLHMVRLEFAIISLSFHPSGTVLAIANGTRLHFWSVPHLNAEPHNHSNKNLTFQGRRNGSRPHFSRSYSDTSATTTQSHTNSRSSSNPLSSTNTSTTTLVEMDQRHMLRCVHFPPNGKTLIIGGVNPPSAEEARRGNRPGGTSFYLRLWDFQLDLAVKPPNRSTSTNHASSLLRSLAQQQPRVYPISNPRVFVPRALLYNDGGFDVSPDGKVLCACVEYWLPDGVDNAMELVHNEEVLYEQKSKLEEQQEQQQRLYQQFLVQQQHSNNSQEEEELGGDFAAPTMDGSVGRHQSGTPRSLLRLSSSSAACSTTPTAQYPEVAPRTPEPTISSPSMLLSPPPPPGRRFLPGGGAAAAAAAGTSLLFGQPSFSFGVATTTTTTPGAIRATTTAQNNNGNAQGAATSPPPLPPGGGANPPPNQHPRQTAVVHHQTTTTTYHPPHPLSTITSSTVPLQTRKGRYVPHVVTISLDTSPLDDSIWTRLSGHEDPLRNNNNNNTTKISPVSLPLPAVAVGYQPRLGQLLDACPLDGGKASAVTCVKFSPSTNFCLIGYGIREPLNGRDTFHPVTSIYRLRATTPTIPRTGGGGAADSARLVGNGGHTHSSHNMCQVSTMLSKEDDVNIARFHPDSGHGFVYGTKQGRVRVVSTRPWMFYHFAPMADGATRSGSAMDHSEAL